MRPRSTCIAITATILSSLVAVQGRVSLLAAQGSLWPSPLTDTCLFDDGAYAPSSEISIEGLVRDENDGVPVPGARVDASWTDPRGVDEEAEAWTDPDGRFRFCGIEEGIRVRLSPEVGGGPGRGVEAVAHRTGSIDLVVPLPSPGEASGLLGTLREVDSDRAVSGAEVRLLELDLVELDLVARSEEDGGFLFERVEPGSYLLRIRHVSYGTLSDTVHLVAGRPLRMTFDLAPSPIGIAGVEATARSRGWFTDRADVRRRMRAGHGAFITRDEIERRNEPPLHRLLGTVPGVRSAHVAQPWGNTYYPVVGACGAPAMFVDGARIAIDPDNGVGINEFLTSTIELIEVYRGAAGAPVQYSDGRAGCGVILIWTRAPGSG